MIGKNWSVLTCDSGDAAGFRKIFSPTGLTLCGAGDTDGPDFRRTRERAVDQAFASYEYEDRGPPLRQRLFG